MEAAVESGCSAAAAGVLPTRPDDDEGHPDARDEAAPQPPTPQTPPARPAAAAITTAVAQQTPSPPPPPPPSSAQRADDPSCAGKADDVAPSSSGTSQPPFPTPTPALTLPTTGSPPTLAALCLRALLHSAKGPWVPMTTDDLIDALAAGTPRGDASSVRERAKTLVRSGRLTRHDRLGCVSVTPTFSLYWLREDWKDAPLFANGAPFEVYIEEAVPQQVEDEEMEQPPSIAARMAKSPSTKQGGDNDADDDKENFVARMDTSASSKPPLVLSKGEESPTTTTTTTVEEAAVTPTPAQKRRKTIGINRYGPLPPYKSPVRTPAGAGTATPRKAATPLRTPLKPYASSSPLTPASNGGSRARVFRPFKPPSSTAGACGHTTPHVGRMMLKRAGLEGASSASGSPERTLEREIQQKELLLTRIKLAESYLLNSEAAKVEALSQKWKQATCEALGEVQQLLGLQDIGPPGSAAGGGGAGGGGGSGGWRRSGFSGGFHRASSPNSGWPLMSDEMRAQCAAQFDADDADGFFERRQRRRDGGGGGGGAGDDGDNDDDDDAADLGKNAGYSEPRLYTFREIATSLGFDLALVKSDAEEDE